MSARHDEAAPPLFGLLPFEETARRVALYEWMESRLFEVMGQWVAVVPEPEVKLALGVLSHEHAWHAELWRDRLPTTERIRAHAGSAAGGHLSAFMAALTEPGGETQTIEKLAGLYRGLLPHLVVTYSRHLAGTSVVADAPVARALKLVLNDETEEWRKGEALIQSLTRSSEDVAKAGSQQVLMERLLVEAGGVLGRAPEHLPL